MKTQDEEGGAPIALADGLIACALTDGQGRICGYNGTFVESMGVDAPTLNRRAFSSLFEPALRAEVEAVMARANAGTPHHVGWTVPGPAGPTHWEFQLVPRAVRQGVFISAISLEAQRSEWFEGRKQLGHSEALTQGILQSAMDAIVTVDERQRIIAFNPAAEQMFGRTAEEVRGENVAVLMPERFRAGHDERVTGFVERKARPRRLAGPGLFGLRPDGSEFPIEASVARVQTPDGYRVTAIIRDVTPESRALQALQDRKERLQLAMESANLGSAEVDLASRRLTMGRVSAELFGLGPNPADWFIDNFMQPVHPDDRGRVGEVFEQIVREDRPLDAEFRIVRRDGTVRWLYGRGRLYRDTQGQPRRVVGVLMDIHARKENEEQLRRLSQRILAVQEEERRHIARELHDQIGQALTAALINLQMLPLPRDSEPAADMRTALSGVLSQVRELSLNLRPSMLDSLGLEAALRWYLDRQSALGKFETELRYERVEPRLPSDTETVVFRLVQEAMTNILRHAKARHVIVQVERSEGSAILTVTDDGVGFDTGTVLARAANGGTSFGVVGMRERAELAGGTVTFLSSPGRGTTFSAVLPVSGHAAELRDRR